jgi:peptidoglycan/xylan/chitin deacetylase (PgdA/CDA1 family)
MATPVEPNAAAISRRRALFVAVAVTAAAGITAATVGGEPSPVLRGLISRQRPLPQSTPTLTPAPSQPSSSVPPLAKPIFTLSDYRKAVPGPAFPSNAIALTIDDGPHPTWTPRNLDLLERHRVPATFFLIGNQVRGHESVARSIVDAGHHIANHTYSHPTTLPMLALSTIHDEIQRAQDRIHSATGRTPTLFRTPGGGWSPPLMDQIAQAGLIPIDWSDDPRDWKRPGTGAIVTKLVAARAGQILLCHDGGGDRSQTYAALQTVVPTLLARGYTFVAL